MNVIENFRNEIKEKKVMKIRFVNTEQYQNSYCRGAFMKSSRFPKKHLHVKRAKPAECIPA